MYQGTTPALTFLIKGTDLSAMTPFASFGRGNNEFLTKTSPDVVVGYNSEEETSILVCRLTQEETLAMKKGSVYFQARFIDSENHAYATDKVVIPVEDVIYKQVIQYVGD